MTLFTNNTQVEYGVTQDGWMQQAISSKDEVMIRATSNVNKYMSWMLNEEIEKESKQEEEKLQMLKIINWWEMPKQASEFFRGSFDLDHYQKVLKAKSL